MDFKNNKDFLLWLAPMEGVTDWPFRMLCKEFGADVMVTEFINSDGMVRDVPNVLRKLKFHEEERPLGIQIYGQHEDAMRRAAEIATQANPDFIDINWGCPVKKIAGRGAGSGIFKDIPKMVRVTKSIVDATHLPVTVKTRLGYEEADKPIVEVAEMLQDVGIAAISIHGRTKVQMYKGEADWTLIGEVKNNPRMHIPVFGNGDIKTPEDALNAKNRYGVDGILIGRATYGNPWIFRQIKEYFATGIIPEKPSIKERSQVCQKHLQTCLQWKDERHALYEMRKHYSHYFSGIENFKPMRIRLLQEQELSKVVEMLKQIEQMES